MLSIDESNAWIIILAVIILFSFLTIWFYYKKDKYEPEPISRIIKAFIYGIISIIPSAILSLIALNFIGGGDFISAVLIAPVVEEVCKALFVVQLSKHESFDGPLDGMIYGAMVGAGFAAGENLLYAFYAATSEGITSGITLATLRSFSQIIGHPLYTGLAGAGIGEAKVGLSNNKYQQLWRAMLLHALWNGSASLPGFGIYAGLTIVIVTSIILLRNELNIAVELDRKAFESGYYERKEEMKMYLIKQMEFNRQQAIQRQQDFQRQREIWKEGNNEEY